MSVSPLLTVLALLLLSGCSSLTRQQLPPERPLPEATERPAPSQLLGNPLQLMFQLSAPRQDELKLADELTAHYQELFLRNGAVLSNLSQAEQRKLDEEIQRSIIHTGQDYQGRQSVDYYLRGSLTRSSFDEEYSAPIWCPFCDDKRPGTCDYELKATLFLEAYVLPTNQRVRQWQIADEAEQSFDAKGRCHAPADGTDTRALQARLRSDITDTLKNCINEPLAAFLTPQAYITNYYSDGEKHYFEISGGSGAGFRRGDTVEVLRVAPAVQGSGTTVLGKAEVSTLVEPRRAIIEVSDKKLISKINRYDKVKVTRTSYSLGMGCLGHVETL